MAMDLQVLRTATRPEHEATEAAMPLLGPDLTRERYGAVLRCLFPVLRSWEGWSGEHAPERLRALLGPRRRSPWLRQDLQTLGLPLADGGRVQSIAWLAVVLEPGEVPGQCTPGEFEAGFLGALYVLEGSTLGGRYLAKQVETSLGLTRGEGNAYFEGHGASTATLWREVTAEVAAVPDDLSGRVVRAANRTFALFREALDGCALQGMSPRMAVAAADGTLVPAGQDTAGY